MCPVSVCTTLFDFGSVSQILMVLSADPVMTKSWLKIFCVRIDLISPLWMPGRVEKFLTS